MASISIAKNNTWVYQEVFTYPDGSTKRHTKRFSKKEYKTEKSALKQGEIWARNKQHEINTGYAGNEQSATLMDFYNNDWYPLNTQNKTQTTDRYISTLENQILPVIGETRLNELTLKQVHAYFTQVSNTKIRNLNTKILDFPSESALENHKKALSNLLTLAKNYQYIQYNPVKELQVKDFVKKEKITQTAITRNSFSKIQANFLLEYLEKFEEDKQFARMMQLMLLTGLRPQELCALDINKSISLAEDSMESNLYHLSIFQAIKTVNGTGTIIGATKTTNNRNVYFSDRVYKIIVEQIIYKENEKNRILNQPKKERRNFGWEKDKDAYFLFSHSKGKPYKPQRIGKKWTKFIQKIPNLPKYQLYSLRHTYATLMLYSMNQNNKGENTNYGATLQAIADSLGHTIDVFIKYYVHPQEQFQKKLAHIDFLRN
ncbi:tyrosine-type recombinase/integrase [Enterococcus plantarum]|uniref:tyrosine-type recombinase/integrase n=1 Tax=Enterococcus plantarum TaxID=1077675 RepID=UPI001A8E7B18|nr:tyrosine-type recombinase/integrase [Enterococcus plantarum]MBO0421437.1 tyrosine-type recombinase/integrase [Enterococcus plantarum]